VKTLRIGVVSTFRDQAAVDLFQTMYGACAERFIKGEISFVFCNREKGESQETDEYVGCAEKLQVPLVRFSSRRFRPEKRREGRRDPVLMDEWRIEYDEAGPERVARQFDPDLVVLAGYMLILGREMCGRWRMINLHPALPWGPKGSWEEVVWELIKTGERETGAMMHLVTPDLDRGPPISYYTVSLGELEPLWSIWKRRLDAEDFQEMKKAEYRTNELFRAIRERQLPGEVPLILLTLKHLSEGRIEVKKMDGDDQVLVDGERCPRGMRMDEAIKSYTERDSR
jgi:phosphoribosylglycinamide formyltransferase-1